MTVYHKELERMLMKSGNGLFIYDEFIFIKQHSVNPITYYMDYGKYYSLLEKGKKGLLSYI